MQTDPLPQITPGDYTVEKDKNKIVYKLFGRSHRDNDLPAVIHADGSRFWFKNGMLHRDNDLPAAIHANGTHCWYVDGKLHRDDYLPAVIHASGGHYWYRNGKFIR